MHCMGDIESVFFLKSEVWELGEGVESRGKMWRNVRKSESRRKILSGEPEKSKYLA